MTTNTIQIDPELLSALFSEATFTPPEPQTIEETRLTEPFIEALCCKYLR